MAYLRHLVPAAIGVLLILACCAATARAQPDVMEELIQAQAQGASEAELINIYRSGLSANSRNRFGVTPLHVACRGKGYLYFAKMLLKEGAGAGNARRGGWTPLMEACSEPGKAQIVRLLLTYGAQADRRKLDGQSALHLAVIVNDIAAARLLVQARANVNIPDMRGRTPVYYVTSVETARLLVENGARLNTVDKTGRSPYVYVRDREREHSSRGQNDVSSCLKSPGAQ